jgi:hypothetical protein
MLHGASQKIADAHAQALAGMSLTDPELQAKCHAAERARDLMWAATVKQADTRFGYKHVSEALRGLGRRRATM